MVDMVRVKAKEKPDTVGKKFGVGRTKPKEIIIGEVENRERILKGLTRAGRLAYFSKLRESWPPEELAAWKESWKRKKETWNKRRQANPKDGGVEEEKET